MNDIGHSLDQATDEALLDALARRESARALEQLYRRHHAFLKGVIIRVIHNEAESDDVLQDVFLQLWFKARRYSPHKGKVLRWLVTLAKRRALDWLRREKAYRRMSGRFETFCRLQEAGRQDGTSRVSHHDLRDVLDKLIHRLPTSQGQALRLAYFQGLSQRQIAASLSVPLGTVKTRIELGMRKLGSKLRGIRETAA